MNKYFIKDNDVSITLTDDFEVTVGAGTAVFSKVDVAFSATPITISAPNDSQDRIDIITLDDLGVISLIEGTPSALPETPYYDADNDMCLCSIRVKQSCKALTDSMINPNFIIKKMPFSGYQNEYISEMLNYQKINTLELKAMTDMNIFSPVSAKNLLFHYSLEETSGNPVDSFSLSTATTNVNDSRKNQNGKINKCFYFNGSEYININVTYNTLPVTMNVWVYSNQDGTNQRNIISNDNGGYDFGIVELGTYGVHYGNARVDTGITVLKNQWVMLTAVITSGLTKFYVNGSLAFSSNNGVNSGGGNWLIGKHANGGYYLGYIDEPSVWNIALSDYQIQYLYNNGLGLLAPSKWGETKTFQLISDTFSAETGLLSTVNTANTTATFYNNYYYPSSSGDYVEIDLPVITGTYTYSALVLDWEKYYDDSITYDVTDGVNTDSGLSINTKNAKSLVINNPTKIKINLNKDSVNPINKYPKIKGYSLILYK
jgi:hypothetical protein